MIIYYVCLFLVCCIALYFAGNWVLGGLKRVARLLGLSDFVVAFFIMAMAATLPNLFLAIMAVVDKVPQLSLGDVMGGNVVDMTLTVALAVFFSKKGVDSKGGTVQTSLIFTFVAAILPLALLLDNNLSRSDGAILIGLFVVYAYWLLSKKERFKNIYGGHKVAVGKGFGTDMAKLAAGIAILLGVAQAIVLLAKSFSSSFGIALPLVGILIVGLGNSFPEIYFGIVSARVNKTKMIMGDIMGAIILPGTLVLGLVALASPIEITDVTMFAAARFFLLTAAIIFYVCARTGQKITKKEALLLLSVYIGFLMVEILAK